MKTKRLSFGVLVAFGVLVTSASVAHADGNGNWTSAGSDSWSAAAGTAGNDAEDAAIIAALVHVQDSVTNLQPEAHCGSNAQAQKQVQLVHDQGFKQPGQAVQAEIGVGLSDYNRTHNGTWYQDGFAHKTPMTTGDFSVGIVDNVSDKVQVHAGIQDLGTVSSVALATASDSNYAVCRDNHKLCWPLSTWYGKGGAVQAYATVSDEKKVAGVPVILEAGVTAFRPTWKETIPNWISSPTATPQLVSVNHDPTLQYSPKFGAGVRLSKNLTLMLDVEVIAARGDQFPAIYSDSGPTYTLEFRQQF
jgi:hypothetical protein